MRGRYRAILCDLFGTLVDGRGIALEGAAHFVESLASKRWAVVTSCGHAVAERLLRRAHLPVPQVLVSADDVGRMKPSPDGYLRAAELLGADPTACLVIEDSSSGIEAAKAAGMDVVAIARGKTQARADKTIAHLGQLALESSDGDEIALTVDE